MDLELEYFGFKNQENIQSLFDIQFSSEFKHTDIQLSNNNRTAKVASGMSHRAVLINKALSSGNCSWKI